MDAHHHLPAAPVRRPLWTIGTYILLGVAAVGLCFGFYRFFFGLRASTNMDQQYPWGIWIVADVSFIALAAGGFTTAAIAHVFHRQTYHALARPALVLALLGYTSACIALAADLGRYYNIWHPMLPQCWQGNSALFEVGMCVMCYLTVLWIEFLPVLCERLELEDRFPRIQALAKWLLGLADKWMFIFVLLGVGISFLHQSSLGNIMVLAGYKLDPLWQTPILSLLFLVSAIAVGFPTVIFMSIIGAWALHLKPRMDVLESLARFIPILLSIYFTFKLVDMMLRGSYVHLLEPTRQTFSFLVEMIVGLLIPIAITLSTRGRRSPRWLGLATFLAMFGIVLNRANVYWIGYQPPNTDKVYFPSLTEWAITLGVLAALILAWRIIVTYFPVVSLPHRMRAAAIVLCGVLAGIFAADSARAEEPSASPKAAPTPEMKAECLSCHTCEEPSGDHRCLRLCSRPRTEAEPEDGPDVVIIRELESAYLPVAFDHRGHAHMAQMTDGCVECHHYSPAGERPPACKSCHSISADGTDIHKPGLKGAYHQRCLNCHRMWMNERNCEACHYPKRGGGADSLTPTKDDLLGRMHPAIPEPKTEFYRGRDEKLYDGVVIFRHDKHINGFGLQCVECHHERSCTRCHASGDVAVHDVRPAEHHRPCVQCHKKEMNLVAREEGYCERCHWREGDPEPGAFNHAETGWPLKTYHAALQCRACHEEVPFKGRPTDCTTCHDLTEADGFDHGVTGQGLDEMHEEIDCEMCHTDNRFDQPPSCTECHDADEGFTFPAKRPGPQTGKGAAASNADGE